MEDRDIVALYWARDEDAIAESERKYGSLCHRIADNILSSREDAEECVSDTWHRAWSAMPEERPDSLKAFLGRIVRNLALDRFRRSHAQKRDCGIELLLSELEDCVPAPVTVERTAETHEITEWIARWLMGLSAEDRALFVRRYWYGESVGTMARERRARPNALTQRLRRLRLALRTELESKGVSL